MMIPATTSAFEFQKLRRRYPRAIATGVFHLQQLCDGGFEAENGHNKLFTTFGLLLQVQGLRLEEERP